MSNTQNNNKTTSGQNTNFFSGITPELATIEALKTFGLNIPKTMQLHLRWYFVFIVILFFISNTLLLSKIYYLQEDINSIKLTVETNNKK